MKAIIIKYEVVLCLTTALLMGCREGSAPMPEKIDNSFSVVRLYEFEGKRYLVNINGGIIELKKDDEGGDE